MSEGCLLPLLCFMRGSRNGQGRKQKWKGLGRGFADSIRNDLVLGDIQTTPDFPQHTADCCPTLSDEAEQESQLCPPVCSVLGQD